MPHANATSSTSAPVASQIALRALIELILCASIAFAASLESSLDQSDVVKIFSGGIQEEYICARRFAAFRADSVGRDPINTRSGYNRS